MQIPTYKTSKACYPYIWYFEANICMEQKVNASIKKYVYHHEGTVTHIQNLNHKPWIVIVTNITANERQFHMSGFLN